MPYIPLLKQPGPIQNAPAPVLDRQQRPNIDNRALSQAVGNLGKAGQIKDVDAQIFTAPIEALGAVGQAVSKAGDIMGALALKRREAETDAQVMQADTSLRVALESHNAWREQNPDQTTWAKNFDDTMGQARQGIDANDKLHPAAREKIKLAGDRFTALARVGLEGDANKQAFAMAKSETIARSSFLEGSKKYDEAAQNDEEALKKGYLWPHEKAAADNRRMRLKEEDKRDAEREAEMVKAKTFTTAQNAAVGMAKNSGEEAAIKDLDAGKFGKFDPLEQERIRNSIQSVSRDRAAVDADALVTKIIIGDITHEGEINAWNSPHLSPLIRQKAKDYLNSRDAQAEAKDREENGVRNAVEMRQKVKEYDTTKDPDRTKYFELVKEIGSRVEQSSVGEITGELYRKYGTEPPKVTVRPEIQQNVSKSLDVTFDPTTGAVPWKSINAEGVTVVNQEERQRAIDAQTTVEMKMNDWFKMHPEKANDLTAVSKAMGEFLPDGTRKGALQTLKQMQTPRAADVSSVREFIEPTDLQDKLPTGLKPHAQDFIDAAREYGLNPRVLAAISALETGGGTSKAFREKQNAMGISDSSGPTSQASVRDSIFRQAKTLSKADGPYAKAKTIEEIGAIYAPPGAENDPKGTNGGWSDGVRAWLSRL